MLWLDVLLSKIVIALVTFVVSLTAPVSAQDAEWLPLDISAVIVDVEQKRDGGWIFDINVTNTGSEIIAADIIWMGTRSDIYDSECRFETSIIPGESRMLTGCFITNHLEEPTNISIIAWMNSSVVRQAVIPFTSDGCDWWEPDEINCLSIQDIDVGIDRPNNPIKTTGLVGATYSWDNNILALHFAKPTNFIDVTNMRVADDRCGVEFHLTQYIPHNPDPYTVLVNTTVLQRESLASMYEPFVYILDEEYDETWGFDDVVPLDTTGSRPYGTHSCVITYGSNELLLDVYTPDPPTYLEAVHAAFESWSDLNPELRFVWVEHNPVIYIQWAEYHPEYVGRAYLGSLGFADTMEVSTYGYDCKGARVPYTPNSVQDTIMHELGHILGLEHHTDTTHLMYGNDTHAQNPFDTLGYSIPEKLPDFFVGEEEMMGDIERLDALLIDMKYELDRLYDVYDDYIRKYGSSSGDTIFFDTQSQVNRANSLYNKYSAYYDQYDMRIDEYNTLIDQLNCMREADPPGH